MKIKNSYGYTLLELMMYMIMAVMIIGFALNMIGRTQKQYGQQRSMSKLQGAGRNTIYIVAADIQNCGFKNFLQETGANTDVYNLVRISGVTTNEDDFIVDPNSRESSPGDGDASFYRLTSSAGEDGDFDSLEFFRGSVNNDGTFNNVSRIKYCVRSGNLTRIERINTETDPTAISWSTLPDSNIVALAENVEALQFEYSTDKINWVDDPTDIKEEIKAIKITILIRTNRAASMNSVTNTYKVTTSNKEVSVSGNYLRRLYSETVEVINNGL